MQSAKKPPSIILIASVQVSLSLPPPTDWGAVTVSYTHPPTAPSLRVSYRNRVLAKNVDCAVFDPPPLLISSNGSKPPLSQQLNLTSYSRFGKTGPAEPRRRSAVISTHVYVTVTRYFAYATVMCRSSSVTTNKSKYKFKLPRFQNAHNFHLLHNIILKTLNYYVFRSLLVHHQGVR
jgi:hypothetical protein